MSRMFRVNTADHALDLKFGECEEYNGLSDTRSPLTQLPTHMSPSDHSNVVTEKSQTFRFRTTFNFLHRSSEADTQKVVENSPVSFVVFYDVCVNLLFAAGY